MHNRNITRTGGVVSASLCCPNYAIPPTCVMSTALVFSLTGLGVLTVIGHGATMDVFGLHEHLIGDYASFAQSFIKIRDPEIRDFVQHNLDRGLLWPNPLLQLNPNFEPGDSIDELVEAGLLHPTCSSVFRRKTEADPYGKPLRLHFHQSQAVKIAAKREPYVLTTGTGSGKSLTYIIPIVDHVLKAGTGQGIQAIIVYPMNALANSQVEELNKFLQLGFGENANPVSYARYTGQERGQKREEILNNPPDILLTNYVMLELILTRCDEQPLVRRAQDLKFLVLDELHTYRGRQGADVAMLVRRCREAFSGTSMVCVGTSATMASEGSVEDQKLRVAEVSTKIFGQDVPSGNVVGETLRRVTSESDFSRDADMELLRADVDNCDALSSEFESFVASPLSSWIESSVGIQTEPDSATLRRQEPRPVRGENGLASELTDLVGCSKHDAAKAIMDCLARGTDSKHPATGLPVFAFRLHQFITRGDTVWSSLDDDPKRFLAMRGQRFVPNDRSRVLFPLMFCRECGMEYYRVEMNKADGDVRPRETRGPSLSEDWEAGYLYASIDAPWPETDAEIISRVPSDWIDPTREPPRIISARRKILPLRVWLSPDGSTGDDANIQCAFVKSPFRFCLNPECGVAYQMRQRSDSLKLATIGVDGRSTATTILASSAIMKLREDAALSEEARKLLSFTDNRQDASLQAGHFNDFALVGLVRSALHRALSRMEEVGIRYDELEHHVERALDLPVAFFANDPEVRFQALEDTRRAFRSILRYLLFRDLERGWRVTSPNLEQCGLLRIEYPSLDELAAAEDVWDQFHPHLRGLGAEQRAKALRILLDQLRRSLVIKEKVLDPIEQEKIQTQSEQRLADPWALDEFEDMINSCIAWPRSRAANERGKNLFLSPNSNYGVFLRRSPELLATSGPLSMEDTPEVITDLLKALRVAGLVEEVRSPRSGTTVPGYQIPASAMIWKVGNGQPFVDPMRVTQESNIDSQANKYFTEFYKTFCDVGGGLEAREHTAQVQVEDRLEREEEFRRGELPVMFCSPTMELGVDIAQLNVVNMRNVPPTPANYAQRSGRAGRSGQPALVYTYCSGFSPHDQYYFQHPRMMVAGAVTPPRVDLVNRDLVRSHVHAVWLSTSGIPLGKTLADVLVVNEQDLSLPIKDQVAQTLRDASLRLKARERAKRVLDSVSELKKCSWYRDDWLDDVLAQLPAAFDAACDRWRSLYKAAVRERGRQHLIVGDTSRPEADKREAKRLRRQAESQIDLLVNAENAFEGDFYSYRYFASEGFLPGYNFPRLPLSAYLPARKGRRGRDEFLSRPRFLAISEFGPRAVVYHEGSQYRIAKVNLAFDAEGEGLTEVTMKTCGTCGYGHLVTDGAGPDVCENCSEPLLPGDTIVSMVRLQNVTAKKANRITSDEEERRRSGYELQTAFQFASIDGTPDVMTAHIETGERGVATLRYGDAVTIWRINLGWLRRANPNQRGFALDVQRGYWASNKEFDELDREDPMSPQVERVVPFVEDRRNALIVDFDLQYSDVEMASMQSAIKQAIQRLYQLESNELAAEPLPRRDRRRVLFFYEAAEGGAGVLRQLVEEKDAFAQVAREAIKICHFDPDTFEDLGQAANQGSGCEAGCYDCLLEYGNQLDHALIDRKAILPLLKELAAAQAKTSAGRESRAELINKLRLRCDSQLERRWLDRIDKGYHRIPTHAQFLIQSCSTRPDFFYSPHHAVIYIDGPPHDDSSQREQDEQITQRLTDEGYLVIRFHHAADWDAIFDEYAEIFGERK